MTQYNITRLKTDDLRRILTEAGLCVVQSGGEYAKVKMIETRLEKDDPAAAGIIKTLRKQSGEKALTTALGAFYLRPAAGERGGGVEFYHKSFGEFLCAKRLKESLEEWTEPGGKRRKFVIDDEQLAREIYDLLGYGALTPEIVEYLIGLLVESSEFLSVELFQRLENFYWRWCDGEFIDAEGTTLPQTKMRQLKEQLPERETYLGQRQVDVYAGLNVMILLLELHRYGQSRNDLEEKKKEQLTFYPCGESEDATLLLRLIGYSHCIGYTGFRDTVGSFLAGADLSGANLYGADLSGANLYSADLSGANLYGANLYGANLSGANLSGADFSRAYLYGADLSGANLSGANLFRAKLSGADLSGADLSGANLSGANLSGANLSGADLYGTNLSGTNLYGTNLENISWDEQTYWRGVRGWETAHNIPEALRRCLKSP